MEQPGTHSHKPPVAARRLGLGAPTLTVESPAFQPGRPIPAAHAGAHGRSPALRIGRLPANARELVLLCEDPDAPKEKPFVHWIVTGLPAGSTELPEGLPPSGAPLGSGAVQGKNDMGKPGYYGPEPPIGHGVHHYHFQVFAVDEGFEAPAPLDRDRLVEALDDHVIAWGELIGTFER
jgi:hypothetical protein